MNALDFCSGLILFIIIIFGVIGNVLSFMVWCKGRRCKKLPGGIYLRALAVSDTTALLIPAMNEAISLVSQFNPKQEYGFFCRLEIIGRHFGLLVSSWIIVCFTVERTLAIWKSKISIALLSKNETTILMVVIFIGNFLLNLPFGIVHEVMQVQSITSNTTIISDTMSDSERSIVGFRRICTADRSSFFSYLNWYHIWFMDWILIFILPFALITGCNLTVLYIIIRKRKNPNSRLGSVIKGVTIRAVVIGVSHCITTGPFSISVLIPGYFSRALTVKYSQEYYINRVCLILAYLNHSMNALLYNFFGSEFRKDCREILCKKKNLVHPDSTETEIKSIFKRKTKPDTNDLGHNMSEKVAYADSGPQSSEMENIDHAVIKILGE